MCRHGVRACWRSPRIARRSIPIQVLDAASLNRTGQADLRQALGQNLPSLTIQAFGSDMAAMTLSARLRGLSPNNTLVLVNGKRRHGSDNIGINIRSTRRRSDGGGTYFKTEIGKPAVTDLEVAYKFNSNWTLALGANNLFNRYPDGINPEVLAIQRANLDNGAVTIYPSFSPIGINGGYYYARANFKF